MIWSPDRYTSSRPFRDQRAIPPPLFETCHFPPCPDDGGGNARTYTSYFPDSFDAYASQRPSGENAGTWSRKLLLRNCSGFPAFNWPPWSSSGTVQIWSTPPPNEASRLPSGVNDDGNWTVLLCHSACGWPDPSARAWKIPLPSVWKITYWPSGLQIGDV